MWNIRTGHVETTGMYILAGLGLVLWESPGSYLILLLLLGGGTVSPWPGEKEKPPRAQSIGSTTSTQSPRRHKAYVPNARMRQTAAIKSMPKVRAPSVAEIMHPNGGASAKCPRWQTAPGLVPAAATGHKRIESLLWRGGDCQPRSA